MDQPNSGRLKLDSYEDILLLIQKGFYEEASLRLRDIRKQIEFPTMNEAQRTWHTLSVLLSSRIAMKGGLHPDHILSIDPNSVEDPFLRGEVLWVRGLYYFNKNQMFEGTQCFEQAGEAFRIANQPDRFLLASYNYLIGQTYNADCDQHWLFDQFRDLESTARERKNSKILGNILRQKSMMFKEAGRYLAGKADAIKAVTQLELYGARSDYQIALLNLVDICLELGDQIGAQEYLERVLPPFDPRVVFPLNYLKHRALGEPLDLQALQASCPHFKVRYRGWADNQPVQAQVTPAASPSGPGINTSELAWNRQDGQLIVKDNQFLFKEGSMEKKLIESLVGQTISKQLLSERLWPGFSELHLLDNRLHRLISRVNKRIGGLIVCRRGHYSLNVEG